MYTGIVDQGLCVLLAYFVSYGLVLLVTAVIFMWFSLSFFFFVSFLLHFHLHSPCPFAQCNSGGVGWYFKPLVEKCHEQSQDWQPLLIAHD